MVTLSEELWRVDQRHPIRVIFVPESYQFIAEPWHPLLVRLLLREA